jgi:carboxyl-terminal processing protease
VNQKLHGADGSAVKLTVRAPGGQPRQVTVTRTLGNGEVVTLGNLPPLRVAVEARERRTPAGRRAGLIWFSVWMVAINEPFAHAIDAYRQHDGLVIDLRGNPGGLAGMMRGIAGHMISEPVDLGTMQTRHTRLTFPVNPRTVTDEGRTVKPFAGPVAILVDELTGSASETFAGSLQSLGRARIFGRTTMGQAMPAVTKQLPNGDVLLYAIGNYTTSTGRSLEGLGVVPDVEVPLSPRALAAGQDSVLDAALKWFDTLKK